MNGIIEQMLAGYEQQTLYDKKNAMKEIMRRSSGGFWMAG